MIQPNELTITIGRLPDNSAFTVDATGRNFIILASVQDLLDEVESAITQHTVLLLDSKDELIKSLERQLHELKASNV